MGNAMFSAEEIGVRTARIAFVSETQYQVHERFSQFNGRRR